MNHRTADYDDPDVEEAWCDERRAEVAAYLEGEGLTHGAIGDWPAWHLAPYVSVWAIQSVSSPGSVGWWVICGDLPTDYVSSKGLFDPREAVRAIAARWDSLAPLMAEGRDSDIRIGRNAEERKALAPLLQSRARLLSRWADDDDMWDFEDED